MDTAYNILTATIVTGIAILMCAGAYRFFDKVVLPGVDFSGQIIAGNAIVGKIVVAIIVCTFALVGFVMAAPADTSRYDPIFRKAAKWQFGRTVHWTCFKAQGMTESNLAPDVCSHVGACGVMQFMPATARAMGLTNRADAKASIRTGIRYDRQLWQQFTAPRPRSDRMAFAFMSYNAGLRNVLRFQERAQAAGVNPNLFAEIFLHVWKEPREYVLRIRRWQKRFDRGRLWASAGC